MSTTYSVSALVASLSDCLEEGFTGVWVEGEISNWSRPASGHWYFTLKDDGGQLRAAMFKNRNFYVRPIPRDGDRVRVRGTVTIYAGRGDLQLICDALELAGAGALLAQLEALKQRLQAEGLFAVNQKRALPALPRHLGVVTSATGAALQDILAAISRRFPLLPVTLWPVPVQGVEAPTAIVQALTQFPTYVDIDVVLLARGGGSLEDLLAFSDERVVRAVAACAVPVVCGVGHEVDFSLADFAADVRGATPTAAAELVTAGGVAATQQLQALQVHLHSAFAQLRQQRARDFLNLQQRLHRAQPARRLQDRRQRLDELQLRLQRAAIGQGTRQRLALRQLQARLQRVSPTAKLMSLRTTVQALERRHTQAVTLHMQQAGAALRAINARLEALNPAAVLQRGYAVITTQDGYVLRSAQQAVAGSEVQARLAEGSVQLRVMP